MTPRYRRVLPTLGLLLLLATPGYADNDYRRWLTFVNPFATPFTSMAWPVVVTPANFDYSHTDPAGMNLYFTDAGGTVLPHYVETWSPGGTSVVWVRVPSMPASATTQIAMYYGGTPLSFSNFALTFPNAYILGSGIALLSGSQAYDWFEIGPGATVVVTGSGLDVTARRIRIRGAVNANGLVAPSLSVYSDGQGTGAGRHANGLCSGAGYGGTGGTPNALIVPPGGSAYGSAAYVGEGGIEAGSSGANSADPASGGSGGGRVRMIARRMDVSGTIAANGIQGAPMADAGGGGGGSGGGILLKAFDLTATGALSAQGSKGGDATGFGYGGGGGGGGRIKVAYEHSVSGAPTMSVGGGAGGDAAIPGRAGADGTTFFGDSNEPAIAHPTIGSEESLKPTAVPTTSWGRVKAIYRR